MEPRIEIADRAAKRIKEILVTANRNGQGLRLKVVGGGPSGLKYELDLDIQRAGDWLFEKDGAKVLIDQRSLLYLNGSELDYKEGLMESGFVIKNPKPVEPCVCRTPFPIYAETPYVPNIW